MKAFCKQIILLFFCLTFFYIPRSQNIQSSIGSAGKTEVFLDTKIDPNDGGTINVGYVDLNTGNSTDLFLVKLDANHQMVWKKTFSNPGSDIFYKVIVCENGDYAAAGQYCVGSLRKGFVCRINSSDGSIIWSKRSTNTSNEQIFWDVTETSNNNIAVTGVENFVSGSTNSFIVLLNSSGANIWSKQSSTPLADEVRNVIQLPNGNLLLIGFYNATGSNYYADITEIDEITASTVTQNIYNISMLSPDGFYTLNSLWSLNIFTRGTNVLIQFGAFQGFSSASQLCSFNYDQTTKTLTGNLYYHPGVGDLVADNFYPLSDNDFLITLSSALPSQTFVSRVINGSVVFDRSINNNNKSIGGMDVLNTDVAFAGNITNTDLDAYNYFTTTSVPTSTSPCDISDANTLTLIPITLSPTSTSVVIFSDTNPMADIALTTQDVSYIINDVCNFVLPVQILNFNAIYKPLNESVSLNWSTSSELNSKEFVVERSDKDGNTYTRIGTMNAAGTSNSISQYKLTDSKPFNGINLYRLKQIDIDGRFKYADIKVVDCSRKKENEYTVSPVPALTFTWLKFNGIGTRTVQVDMMDATGKLLKQRNAVIDNSNPLKLELAGYSTGIYFLKISSKNNSTTIKKIVIE